MRQDAGAQAQRDGSDDSLVNGASRDFPSTSQAACKPCLGLLLFHESALSDFSYVCRMLVASG